MVYFIRMSDHLGIQAANAMALSTTKVEYIPMLMVLHDVILIMNLIHEMKEHNFDIIISSEPYIYCKVFEDN